MSQIAGLNPWLSMWSRPRSTIRAIVHSKPEYCVFFLAAIFALQSFFFYANWWSFGLRAHLFILLLLAIIISPIIGIIWLYFTGYIFQFTGRWLSGHCPSSHLRTAIAWSKIPTSINLLMWLIFIAINPEYVFIQDGGGPSSIFINFISLILGLWSFILLLQAIREVQHFTLLRSFINILLASIISTLIFFLGFLLVRYIYINI